MAMPTPTPARALEPLAGPERRGFDLRGALGSSQTVRALVALVALLVFISACGSGGGAESQRAEEEPAEEKAQTTAGETQAAVEKSEVASAETQEAAGADLGNPSLGDEDAPVVMVEYADYQ